MNLPNKITMFRIIMLPVFLAVGLIAFPYNNFVALGLFIFLAYTDYLDGHIARKHNLVTNLGKFLDPIADKLLCTTGLLILIVGANPIIPNPYGIICVFIILLRDYAVTGLRQIAQLKGIIIPADKLGKIKANFQYVMTVFGFLIGGLNAINGVGGTEVMKYITLVFYIFVGVTTALVLISGLTYIFKNLEVFKDDDKKEDTSNAESSETIAQEQQNKPASKNTTTKTASKSTTKKSSVKKTTSKQSK
ncbi:MAG: CDP-diacylglycerol--glycerol-3-phosphate 3-phosphatidyltransferase [Clostridia bacterium]|nr:CDP-diacylglycerol--glycerol-3-phosphate 3-phosphatidyltransferase [Clostridia bacterium]